MIQFNHTIIHASNNELSANFLAEILGLPKPFNFGPFMVVKTQNDVSLAFATIDGKILSSHYAFLVSDDEFDEILSRVQGKKIVYWADHQQENTNKINHFDGGRGFYFNTPDGHFLEIITRPYNDVR
ncbi:MAG: VOC family protein [Legionellaceae bacterium]|nr:VOC family protein [Legionellaceae bacterium]